MESQQLSSKDVKCVKIIIIRMAVSLDIFRQSIGLYQLSGTKKMKSFKKGSFCNEIKRTQFQTSKTTKLSDLFLCCALYLTLFLFLNVTNAETKCPEKNIYRITGNTTQGWKLLEIEEVPPIFLITWCTSIDTNKLCHIMFGNRRRNIGYKYFTWNCDQGLLSRNKLEDIKCFAAKHKPHFMGISEIDFRRDENNVNYSSTNTFSTQQVNEKFKIEGYRVILPESWTTYNKARLLVFAHEEMNIKVRQTNENENHLQSVLLEVGYGRSKTHLVNFFYREWKNCVTGKNDKASQLSDLSLLSDTWRRCTAEDRDFIALGDINICAKQWDDPSYVHCNLADIVKDF